MHLMDEIGRRKLQLIGSEELAKVSTQTIAEVFDDPGFLELYQRAKQRLAERRPTEARERTIDVPPLTEARARALVALIDREERLTAVQERAAVYETDATPSEAVREDLASLKESLLRALEQDTPVKTG